ncbi:MAG TPA: efflux RND transporter periplasmic adaptor subunit [Geobacteraceae bacterium]
MKCFVINVRKSTFSPGVHLLYLFMFLFVITLSACSSKKDPPKERPPVPVVTAGVVQKSVPVQIRAIGNVEAYNTVSVKAQVNGTISRVHFTEGEDVAKGRLLFAIDPRPFEAALRRAEATLAKDRAQARFAREQAQRYGSLLKDGIVTKDQSDQLLANADALDAAIAADRATVEDARILLGYCYIRSPIDGRTGNLAVRVGNLVKANDVPVLVTITQLAPIFVAFTVPEKELLQIKKYLAGGKLRVDAVVPNDPKGPENGTISFLDNAVDTTTGTIKLKGTFANKDRRLWPGQFVNVVLTLTSIPDALVVPTQALQTGQTGQYVFIVKGDRSVESRPVAAGQALDGETVVTSGLRAGETVVIDGQLQLAPGTKVEIRGEKGKGRVARQ